MISEKDVLKTDTPAFITNGVTSATDEVVNESVHKDLLDTLKDVQSLQKPCIFSNRKVMENRDLEDLSRLDTQSGERHSFGRAVATYDAVDECVKNKESDTVSTQTEPGKIATGVETGVQAEIAVSESSRKKQKRKNLFSYLPQDEDGPSTDQGFSSIEYFNKKFIPCPYTIRKNKYSLSMMLVYMILTGLFSRLNHYNLELSNLPRCSIRDGVLTLNGITLLLSVASLGVQLVLDSANIHNNSCFIFSISMSTIQFLLQMLAFARIYYCDGSVFDYSFPLLTLLMCFAYTLIGALCQPRLLFYS